MTAPTPSPPARKTAEAATTTSSSLLNIHRLSPLDVFPPSLEAALDPAAAAPVLAADPAEADLLVPDALADPEATGALVAAAVAASSVTPLEMDDLVWQLEVAGVCQKGINASRRVSEPKILSEPEENSR